MRNRMEKRMRVWLNFLKYYIAVLLVITPVTVNASAKTSFKEGVRLFEAKKYSLAIKEFEKAKKQGLKSTALYYNLGSTYYKLKNYKKSKYYFKKLRKRPEMKSLAEYNLGLISSKQGNEKLANKYFRSVIRDNVDNKLVYLSKNKLRKTQALKKPWSAYAGATLGYDDNINVAPVGIVANESDVFTDYVLTADYILKGSRKNGWISNIIYTNTNFIDTNTYDQSQIGAGINKTKKINYWDTSIKLNFDKLSYSHEDYQSIIKLETQGKYNWSKNNRVYLKYRYENISSDRGIYDYLEGWKQQLKAEFRQYARNNIKQFYYEIELNDREDLVITEGEFSYSPTRHKIRVKYTEIINNTWRVTGDAFYQTSDYPATADQDRDDQRLRVAAYADYRITKIMQARIKLEFTDNNSNETIYDFTRTVFTLGISAFF